MFFYVSLKHEELILQHVFVSLKHIKLILYGVTPPFYLTYKKQISLIKKNHMKNFEFEL
jgi:hypothetical protein